MLPTMPVPNRSRFASFALKTLTGAVASAVLMASAHAAGLGKLTVLSSLGQPLRAEIELTAVSADEAAALVAKLAPADAYRVANIDFNPALLLLRFDVEQRAGRQVIKVSSSQPINEPFVDMLMELNWNGGRIVREYTFLLDPAEMRATQAPQVAAPVDLGRPLPAAPAPAPAPAAAPANAAAPLPAPAASAPAMAAQAPAAPAAPAPGAPPASQPASEYTVKNGDNLSRIASQVKPQDVSLDMMLVALYRANPEAFAGNNMNRLKSGQILAVPGSDDIRASAPEGEARGVVVAHAADFAAYRAKLAGQVANSTPAKEADPAQNVTGKITAKVEEKPNAVNAAKDKLTLSKATSGTPEQGKTGLAVEDKIAKQKELEEADARTRELEKNVRDLENLMAMKSKAAAKASASASASASVSASASASAEAAAPAKPKRTLVLPPKKAPEPSIFEILMDNLQYVGIAAATLLAGGGALFAARRRRKFEVPKEETIAVDDPAATAQSLIEETGGQSVDTSNSVFNSNFAPSASQLDTNEVDPVAEADVYIAYGRDAQAEEILKEALRVHPERHPARLKLLEIYTARKDLRGFEEQAEELYSLTRGQGDEWTQAAAMGQALDPANPLYTRGPDTSAPAAAESIADAADPFATSADAGMANFDAGMETALPQAADAGISPASVAAENSNLMDFDLAGLSFEPVEDKPGAIELPASPAEAAAAPLDAIADLDFTLDLPGETAPATQNAGASDALDLDLAGFDMAAPAAPAAEAAAAAAAAEDDLADLLQSAEEVTPAPAPAAQEFDLSSIDLDLPEVASAAAAPADAAADEPMSAQHMEMDTKLDLAVAYQEIGDKEGARELLEEVLRGGNGSQIAKANTMLAQLG